MSIPEIDADIIGFNPSSFPTESIEPKQFHYIIEVQKLVAQILAQLSRANQTDHQQIEKMKRSYEQLISKAGDEQRSSAQYALYSALTACATSFLQFGMPNQNDQQFLNVLSKDLIPQFGGMITTPHQVKGQMSREEAMLKLEEYRNKTAARQSEGNSKQDFLAVLNAAEELKRAASRGMAG